MLSDEQLYSLLLAGDREAAATLVQRYQVRLQHYFYRALGDYHAAEDLMQETFARLTFYHGRAPHYFRAWCFTIATNLLRDYMRAAYQRREQPRPVQRLLEREEQLLFLRASPQLDDTLARKERRSEISKALQGLPWQHRQVLVLHYFQDLKIDEIARLLATPSGTVKSRLSRGLRQLRRALEQTDLAV